MAGCDCSPDLDIGVVWRLRVSLLMKGRRFAQREETREVLRCLHHYGMPEHRVHFELQG